MDLKIPKKLYSKEKELKALLAAFERVREGSVELLLVQGADGCGKSRFVDEIQTPVALAGGCFISGKFENFKKDIPYQGFIQAFQGYFRQLLTGSEDRLFRKKEALLKALGLSSQVIFDLIPEIKYIVGRQPVLEKEKGLINENNFNYFFTVFIDVLLKSDTPLVLFLDDWQWADEASIQLLEVLASNLTFKNLLLICACRNSESETVLNRFKQANISVKTIKIVPLEAHAVDEWICDTFFCKSQEVAPLVQFVHQTAKGNPFFIIQILRKLHRHHLLTFDLDQQSWKVNVSGIEKGLFADEVVELMSETMLSFPEVTQILLKKAAVIGNSFDLNVLAKLQGISLDQLLLDLSPALEQGFLCVKENGERSILKKWGIEEPGVYYFFAHDRIHQAIYELVPVDHRHSLCLEIGIILIGESIINTAAMAVLPRNVSEKVMEIVHYLNRGIEWVELYYPQSVAAGSIGEEPIFFAKFSNVI